MHIPHPITALITLAASALAHGGGGRDPQHGGGHPPRPACLNATGVNTLVNGYTYLLEHPGGADFNSTAEAILSDTSFMVDSDSILTLSGRAVRIISIHAPFPFIRSFEPIRPPSESGDLRDLWNLVLTVLMNRPARPARLPLQSGLHCYAIPDAPASCCADPGCVRDV